MNSKEKPVYLYNPDQCPCTRGPKGLCPRYKDCDACTLFHHSNPRTPLCSCERMAEKEGFKVYRFYGALHADCAPLDMTYARIRNPRDLYDLLKKCWCADTCAPRMRQEWSEKNPALGQCSITAFLAQDIFGGKVYGIPREGGHYHCYNVVDGCVFDLTSEQFGSEAKNLVYENNPGQLREVHFSKKEKEERYELLKQKLAQQLT